MGAGVNCIKYLLFIFNFIIALSGLGLVVIGCLFIFGLEDNVIEWIKIDTIAEVLQNEFLRSAVYLVIAAGGMVFLIAVCGCLGAIMGSKCLLGLYFFFLMIIFAAQLAAGILSAIYGNQVTDYLANESKEFLMTGFNEAPEADVVNKTITAAWNEVQTVFECCGVEGAGDYPNGPPDSCCLPTTDFVAGSCGATAIAFTDGCQAILEDLIEEYETILAATAVGVACFELFCMLFAICLCRNIDEDD